MRSWAHYAWNCIQNTKPATGARRVIPADNGPLKTTGEIVEVPSGATNLQMMLYRAESPGPAPVVIACPGGTEGGLFEIMEWACSRLRAAGYNALTASWRAASPVHDPEDVAAAIDWLLKQNFADPKRIAVFGGSRGANAALRAVALDKRISAAVTFGAATDFLQLAIGAAAYAPSRYELFKSWLGDPITQRAHYEKVQAISYAQLIDKPVLLIHGRHDFHCPVEQSIMMRDKIAASGNTQVELELLPWVGHYGDVVPNGYAFNHISSLIISFLDRHLRVAH
jgi:dipeptidyl aminopeptidase/acylaminoacyl peptidase